MQFWCEHDEDGSLRAKPYNPSLATPDMVAKVTNFMWWVSRNCPGMEYAKKAAHMVSGVTSVRPSMGERERAGLGCRALRQHDAAASAVHTLSQACVGLNCLRLCVHARVRACVCAYVRGYGKESCWRCGQRNKDTYSPGWRGQFVQQGTVCCAQAINA